MKASNKKIASGASLAAAALLLGGCQALGIGSPRMARVSADANLAAQARDIGNEQLEAGRTALTEGRTADAIEAFMLAKAFPEQMPAAYNGLAVAYSRLGRTDLTERFFLTAAALAPEESRYRSNLATFYSRNAPPKIADPVVAMAPSEQGVASSRLASAAATRSAPPSVRTLPGGLTVHSPSGSLQRVSKGEVAILTAQPAAAAVHTATAPRRPVINVGGSQPPAYPIRMTLAEPKPRAQAYPIRIPLQD